MLVPEVYPAFVDTLGDVLADLVRRSSLNHVKPRPSIFSLGSARGADEQGVFELSLQIVLLDMIGQSSRDFSDECMSKLS